MKLFHGINLLNKKYKLRFYKIVFFQFIKTLFEVVTLASLIPLIYFLVEKEKFLNLYNEKVKSLNISNLQIYNFENFLYFLLLGLFTLFLLKTIFMFFSFKYEIRFQQKLITKISTVLFQKYLNMDVDLILLRKKNELTRNLNSEVNSYVKFYVQPLYQLINEVLKMLGISIILLLVNKYVFLIGLFVVIFGLIIFKIFFEIRVRNLGEFRVVNQGLILKYIQEGIDSLKEIRLTKNRNYFKNLFKNLLVKNEKIILSYNLIAFFPRHIIEFLAFTLIVSIIYISYFYLNESFSHIVINLAIFGAALFRLLPSMYAAYQCYSQITFANKGIEILKQENMYEKSKNIFLENNNKNFPNNVDSIKINNVSYKYPNSNKEIFKNLNLQFESGKIYGIKGLSGAGKSTFINLVMGFLKPQKGEILVNNNYNIAGNIDSWHRSISYVPQKIFITNDTVKKNIAFAENESETNLVQINDVIKSSSINDFIKSDLDLSKDIGQDGTFFSEGQKQRVGIARALYHNRNVLFFDEFTSSLDTQNEEKILNNLLKIKKNKIIFLISHSDKVLKYSDKILRIENGDILN